MLSQLYIKNIAVIKEATIDFTPGFNVFTGETGAGKTILVGAINAVLGERTSKDLIRTGETNAQVAALFDGLSSDLYALLEELGYPLEYGESLLIRRSINEDGRTQCRIGEQPATAAILRRIANQLINVHGQHDSQQLLSVDKHLDFIDAFGDLREDLSIYHAAYAELKRVAAEMETLTMNEAEKARKVDLLSYQVQEIEAAQLQDGEEEELLAQRKRIRNAERITSTLAQAHMLLQGDGEQLTGIGELLEELNDQLSDAGRYLDGFEEMAGAVADFKYELEEYSSTIQDALEEMEYDPEQIAYVEERLDTISNLKRKYGNGIPEILLFLEQAQEELDSILFSEEHLQQLQQQHEVCLKKAQMFAKALSEKRHQAAALFIEAIQKELAFLDMASVSFSAKFTEKALGPTGMDSFELLVSTNVGEEPKPLAKIASGGELSRIMLAIKNVSADQDGVDTLIFDEVDAGVSGRAAQKIGRKLMEVSRNRQVICVTHLAQVAAFGTNHLLISKSVQDGKTFTSVCTLDEDARRRELARIIGGDIITPATLEAAQEIIEKSR